MKKVNCFLEYYEEGNSLEDAAKKANINLWDLMVA